MTKRLIKLFHLGRTILGLAAIMIMSGCGEESNYKIKEQDKVFIAKIKDHLKSKGDTVRVAEIHPGGWEAVCINPVSAYSTIEVKYVKGVGLRPNGIKIINDPVSTYANDRVWGIYFHYPGNKVEYYRIPIEVMTGYVGIRRPMVKSKQDLQMTDNNPQAASISTYLENRKYDTPVDGCIAKDKALLIAVDDANEWNKRLQAAKESGTWNGVSIEKKNSDFIVIRLTKIGEDK